MAKPVSEEELQLKKRARRRLIGAIVLVAVVAVVLPMVLDSDPKPTSQDINIQIPSQDSKGFASKVVPLASKGAPDKSDAKAVESQPVSKAPDKVAAKPPEPAKEVAVPEKPAPKSPDKAAVKGREPKPEKAPDKASPPPKAAEKPADKAVALKPGMFFIQVTALADPGRAKAVQQRILDAGLPAYTQEIPAGKGNVTRVRAGPFAARAEAEKAQTTLQGIGLEGKVSEVK